jgi:hypothetical protein
MKLQDRTRGSTGRTPHNSPVEILVRPQIENQEILIMIHGRMKAASILAFTALIGASMVLARPAADEPKKLADNASFDTPAAPVQYFSRKQVEATFNHETNSETLYNSDYGSKSYEVKASRRVKELPAETHSVWTDVIYVEKGAATLVTGGKLAGDNVTPKAFPDGRPYLETHTYTKIDGGERRRVSVGDVVVIPNGTPHWFVDIDGPFWFFNVKTR